MFVSQLPHDRPTLLNHTWSSTNVGTDILAINLRERATDPPTTAFFIGVTAYGGPAAFTIAVAVSAPADDVVAAAAGGGVVLVADAVIAPDTRECEHCGARVPAMSYDRHTAFCARNNTRCVVAGCGKTIRRGEEAQHAHCDACELVSTAADIVKHKAVWHSEYSCECGLKMKLKQLIQHARVECERRLVMCRYCGSSVVAGGVADDEADALMGLCGHESYCGSRTRSCPLCADRIALKRFEEHSRLLHAGATIDFMTESPVARDDATASTYVPCCCARMCAPCLRYIRESVTLSKRTLWYSRTNAPLI